MVEFHVSIIFAGITLTNVTKLGNNNVKKKNRFPLKEQISNIKFYWFVKIKQKNHEYKIHRQNISKKLLIIINNNRCLN
jgi:hypothetical protein